ncbi:aminoacrylate peracid reductase [Myxococcaceae bacterium]|jgi:2-iminobutanoate/2-iminopropanoate deaminase|nr:aminoacrylate peracid reductase [Myxococcaceae bacterium]
MREIRTDAAPKPVGPYSQAIVHGGLVFCSGQIPLAPSGEPVAGEIEAQTERVIENLAAVLEAAGSSLRNVLRTTVYLADLSHFARMNAVYERRFDGKPPPARSTIQAGALPRGLLVEIDVIAALD